MKPWVRPQNTELLPLVTSLPHILLRSCLVIKSPDSWHWSHIHLCTVDFLCGYRDKSCRWTDQPKLLGSGFIPCKSRLASSSARFVMVTVQKISKQDMCECVWEMAPPPPRSQYTLYYVHMCHNEVGMVMQFKTLRSLALNQGSHFWLMNSPAVVMLFASLQKKKKNAFWSFLINPQCICEGFSVWRNSIVSVLKTSNVHQTILYLT